MRRAIIIAMLALAGCSPERVQTIGLHQYKVTGMSFNEADVKADEICAKLERKWIYLGIPEGSPPDEIRFECVNSYEIVPAGANTYRIRVLSSDMPLTHFTIPGTKGMPGQPVRFPDSEPGDKESMRRATEFCAKMNQTVKVTGGGFDAGPGLDTVFKCVPRGTGAP
jgi:hypothetical protein